MSTTSLVPPPLPPGLTYVAALPPSLNMLMIGTVWSSMLVPMLIALLLFSTKELRRKPIFILNVVSVLMGIAMGILNAWLEFKTMLSPDQTIPTNSFVAMGCLTVGIPIFVESILVIRLLAVYPPARTSRLLLWSIFGPLFIIKVARVVNAVIFMVEYAKLARQFPNPIEAGQVTWHKPGEKIEWFLQVFDNTAASLLFLKRLQWGKSFASLSGSANTTSSKRMSYATKLKTLFWISLSNFVFPVLLSIIQLVFRFRDPSYLDGTYVFLTNNYVEIVGVLLATVWAAGTQWTDGTSTDPAPVSIASIQFRKNDSTPVDSFGLSTRNGTHTDSHRTIGDIPAPFALEQKSPLN
ncbi:hypothetical protein B0H10DRAFT_2010538 [Mycena sp. CBHHK59/15]|nr:hypothetical protein B0H10DRAFT_2010538 [Mycena sp. CBHHK59/15]